MGVKISQLPAISNYSALRGTDIFPIVDQVTAGTKQLSLDTLSAFLLRTVSDPVIGGKLANVAQSGLYSDLIGAPAQFVLRPASANLLGGVKIGANLQVAIDGTLSATPGFQQINVGNQALTQTTSALTFFAGNNMTLTADPVTNSITFSSSGSGVGGSGNVGPGDIGSMPVYFNTGTVTGTNITYNGLTFSVPGVVNAGGIVVSKLTATTITSAGDISLSPTGNISAGNKRIINLSDPQGSQDGATKAYVDSQKAFGKVSSAGQPTVTASSNTDTLNIIGGNNVFVTTNPNNRSVTIAVNNTLSFALLPATTTTIGGIIVGRNLTIDQNGVLNAQAGGGGGTTATTATLGSIIVGSGLAISAAGTLTALAQVLGTATSTTLGGVKIGPGIVVTSDGTIEVAQQSLTSATNFLLGGVKIGQGIAAAGDGTISVSASGLPFATSSSTGVVRPGYGLSVDSTGTLNLGVNGNFTITGNLAVNGAISATSIITTGANLTIISSANDLQLSAVGSVTATAPILVTTSTEATSPSTGALIVGLYGINNAGLGVAGAIYSGQDANINGVKIGAGGGSQPNNVAMGTNALSSNITGRYLTAIGAGALQIAQANDNVGIGYSAGNAVTQGSQNTFLGNYAGAVIGNGQNNVGIGYQNNPGKGASSNNVGVGANQLTNIANSPSNLVYLGSNIQNTTPVPGSNVIAIGANALGNSTGSNLVIIGYGAGSGLTSATNQVIIGGYAGTSIGSAAYNGYVTIADGAGNLKAQWTGGGILTQPGAMTVTNATVSADIYSGALVIAGGVGIQGTLNAVSINAPTILSNGSQVVTFANLGTQVSSVNAGVGISVSTTTGAVVVNNTATLQQVTNNGYTTTNKINITNGASAISSVTGALIVTGGISTQDSVYAHGSIYTDANIYVGGGPGVGNPVLSSINWTGNAISIATTSVQGTYYATVTNLGVTQMLVYNTGSGNLGGGITGMIINASTGTVGITPIDTIDTVAHRMFNVSGQATISSIAQLTMTNVLSITNTATSTGTAYGALTVQGGVGIGGSLYVGGSLLVNGYPLSTSTTFNGGTITGKIYVQNAGSSSTVKTNNAIGVDGGIYASAFYLNGSPLSTSTVWNGGTVSGQVIITNASPAVSTASAALTVVGGIGTQNYIWARGYKDEAGRPIGEGPTFSAINSSTQSIPNGAFTKVQFNSVNWDTDSAFDVSTGGTNYRFSPPVAGYYQIIAGVKTPPASSGISQIAIYKNGGLWRAGGTITNSATNPGLTTVSGIIDLQIAASDYVEIWLYQNSGSSMTLPNVGTTATYFESIYVRPWTIGAP